MRSPEPYRIIDRYAPRKLAPCATHHFGWLERAGAFLRQVRLGAGPVGRQISEVEARIAEQTRARPTIAPMQAGEVR